MLQLLQKEKIGRGGGLIIIAIPSDIHFFPLL